MNVVQIKHGPGVPPNNSLQDREFGFSDSTGDIFIGVAEYEINEDGQKVISRVVPKKICSTATGSLNGVYFEEVQEEGEG